MPFGDPFSSGSSGGFGDGFGFDSPFNVPSRRRLPGLSPEEEESMLMRAASGSLSGLQWIGEILAKPQRALFGALAGKPYELLNLIPFSDSLGITDPAESVDGRQLLEEYGILDENQAGLDSGDVAGFALDVIADPLNVIAPFALAGKGAKFLKAAGKTDELNKYVGAISKATGRSARAVRTDSKLGDVLSMFPGIRDDVEHAFKAGGYTGNMDEAALGGYGGIGLPNVPFFGKKIDKPVRDFANSIMPGLGDVPLGDNAFMVSELFPNATKKVVSAVDEAVEAISKNKYAAPVIEAAGKSKLAVKAVMYSRSLGATTKLGQKYAEMLSDLKDGNAVAARKRFAEIQNKLVEMGRTGDEDALKLWEALEGISETVKGYLDDPELEAIGDELAHTTRGVYMQMYDDFKALGGKMELLDDDEIVRYAPRLLSEVVEKYGQVTGHKVNSAFDQHSIHRADALRNIGGGTRQIIEMVRDKGLNDYIEMIRQAPANQAEHDQWVKLLKDHMAGRTVKAPTGTVLPTQTSAKDFSKNFTTPEAADNFVETWIRLSPEARAEGLFGNHPLVDSYRKSRTAMDRISAIQVGVKAIAEAIKISDTMPLKPGQVKRSLDSVLTALNIDNAKGRDQVAAILGIKPDELSTKVSMLHPDLAEDISRTLLPFQAPKEVHWIVDAFDSYTNLFKGFVTGAWPAFHARNLVSGLYQNWAAGVLSKNDVFDILGAAQGKEIKGLSGLKPIKDRILEQQTKAIAHRDAILKEASDLRAKHPGNPVILAEAQKLDDMAAKVFIPTMDDRTATDMLRRMMYEYDVVGKNQGLGLEVGGKAVNASIEDHMKDIFGGFSAAPGNQLDFKQMGKNLLGERGTKGVNWVMDKLGVGPAGGMDLPETTWNPLKAEVRGVGGGQNTNFAPLKAGEELSFAIEGSLRGSAFLNMLRKGINPAEAASRVGKMHVNYGSKHFSKFERTWGQRIFPFYKFQSRMIPYVLEELVTNPGGRMGKTIHQLAKMKGDPSQPLPEYIANTTAIPIWETEDGERQYITGVGLMFEDPVSWFTGDIGNTLYNFGGRLNPAIKGPVELMTGVSLWQEGPFGGRRLDDMDPGVGRLLSNAKLGPLFGQPEGYAVDNWMFGDRTATKFAEAVVANSPLARLSSTLRQMTDTRKGLAEKVAPLVSGVKVNTISEGAEDALIQDIVDKMVLDMGGKPIIRTYTPEARKDVATPSQLKEIENLAALQRTLQRRKVARRKKKEKEKKDE